MGPKPESIRLHADPAELVSMREFVAQQARGSGMVENDIFRACLVATEAVTNAMRHGCGPDAADCPITVTCSAEGDEFVLEVTDRGRFRSQRARDDDSGGRGLFLIRELTSAFDLRAEADGTHLSMRIPAGERALAVSRAG